jgi:hypothetical protein
MVWHELHPNRLVSIDWQTRGETVMRMLFEGLNSLMEDLIASFYDFIFEPKAEELGFEGPREWFIKDDANA